MAQVVETHILVTISQLVKSGGEAQVVVNEKTIATIETAVEELLEEDLPAGAVIEVGPQNGDVKE